MDGYGDVGGLGALVWVFTGLLLLLTIVTMLAARGIIPLNMWVGIRIPSVQRSEKAWRAGHAAAVPASWVGFIGALICSVIGLYFPLSHWGVVVFFVGAAVWTMVVASRAAKAVD